MQFFFLNDTATTDIYTRSLHDALPIWSSRSLDYGRRRWPSSCASADQARGPPSTLDRKSTTSELQSRQYLVCRLLLEKNKERERRQIGLSIEDRRVMDRQRRSVTVAIA